MLVATLSVEVGSWVGTRLLLGIGVEVEDRVGAGARLEPDVEDVHLFAEFGVTALFTGCFGWQDFFRRVDVPGVGGFALEEFDYEFIYRWIFEWRGAFAAEEDGNGDSPDALAGDAPVGTRGDHVGDAVLSP